MNKEHLAALSDQQLLVEAKKSKNIKIYDAAIIGVLIGIAIYSSVKNGFGLLTFLPLVYLPIAGRNRARNSAVEKLLRNRDLK